MRQKNRKIKLILTKFQKEEELLKKWKEKIERVDFHAHKINEKWAQLKKPS
jgi:hypothetical protein